MFDPTSTNVTTPADQRAPGELSITFDRDDEVRFEGTAAQLIEEGLIPEDLDWPHADLSRTWKIGRLEYRLNRTRPVGHRGPKSSWIALDNWALRTRRTDEDFDARKLRRLEREVEQLRFNRSPAGAARLDEHWERWLAADRDESFQKLKSRLLPSKPRATSRYPSRAGTKARRTKSGDA